jgi:hypothetical protein
MALDARSRQELKPKKRLGMKSFECINAIAAKEKARLAALATARSAQGEAGKKLRAGLALVQGAPPAKKARVETGSASIEVIGDESRSTKKSVVDDVDISYILWGNSQKIQLAGVLPSGFCYRSISKLLFGWWPLRDVATVASTSVFGPSQLTDKSPGYSQAHTFVVFRHLL